MHLFSTLLSLATSALLLLSAKPADEDQKGNWPCSCPKGEAEEVVRARQAQFNNYMQNCQYLPALALATPKASWATVDYFCGDKCCFDVGDMPFWFSYYSCYDNIAYPKAPQSLVWLKNGTAVMTLTEIQSRKNGTTNFGETSYVINYFWFPVPGSCDFKLGYLTANAVQCPAYVPKAPYCYSPECNQDA